MSLDHDILLLADTTDEATLYFDYEQYAGGSGYEVIARVSLPDDLFAYMADSFKWMPTVTPMGNDKTNYKGLDRFGITEVLDAHLFRLIIRAWINLFLQEPHQ